MSRTNLLQLQITNFKKIETAEVDFQGRSFLLVGKNQVGKTSFIQALKILLNIEQLPPDPVTKGKERGSMKTVFEKNGKKYHVSYEFTDEKAAFKFTDENGMPVQKPKTVLDSMVGPYVDIFEIINQQKYAEGRRANEVMFLKLANLDAEIVYKFDADIKTNENNRLEVGREVTRLKGVVDSAQVDTTITQPIDLEPIYKAHMTMIEKGTLDLTEAIKVRDERLAQMIDKGDHAMKLDKCRERYRQAMEAQREIDEANSKTKSIITEIEQLEIKILLLKEQETKLRGEIQLSAARLNTIGPIAEIEKMGQEINQRIASVDQENARIKAEAEELFEAKKSEIENRNAATKAEISAKLQAEVDKANEHNQKLSDTKEYLKAKSDMETQDIAYEDLTRTIVDLRDRRRAYIMTGAFPIEGMEYTDEGIKYNGMLLDPGVLSTSDIIELGIKLSNAYNPHGINFMPIPNASLFDQEHISRVQEFLQSNGLIGAFEMVDRVQDHLTIEFIN